MSRRSTAPHGEEGLTSSQAASPAKTLASPERAQDSTASEAASGSKCFESFARFDPATSTWRTSQRSLVAGWIEYSARWPKQGSMRSGCAYPRPPWAPPTDATDGGVWLGTPTCHPRPRTARFAQGRTPNIAEIAQQFPTPRAGKTTDEDEQSWRARHEQGKVATPPLSLAVRMIPTPTAGDAKSAARANYTEGAMHYGVTLTDFVRGDGGTGRTWPTPTADDANNVTRTSGAFQSLSRAAQQTQLPTPTTQDAHNNGAPSQLERNAPPRNAVVGGKLNADWVELLMGWPAGWTALPPDSGTEIGKRSRGSRKGKPTA